MSQIINRPAALALIGTSALLTGCQSYEPKPLDLERHDRAWRLRSIGDEPVRAFADRLSETNPEHVFDLSDGLSMAEAETVALVYNPGLRRARLASGVASATALHAGSWEDPQFGLDFLTLTERVSDPLQITPGLAFTIPISGRLDAEQDRANADLDAAHSAIVEQEWATRISVRRSWVRWSANKLQADATRRLLSSIEQLVESTQRLARAGEMPSTESALFAIEQAQLRRHLRRYEGMASVAEQEIRGLLGIAPGAPLGLVPSVTPPFESDTTKDGIAQRNPTLQRLRDEYAASEHALRREVLEQYPDLTIGPLADFDRGETLLGFSFSLPIPILNANKQGIAEADARRDSARAAFETRYEMIVGQLEAAKQQLNMYREQLALLEAEIIPLTDKQLADAQRLIGLGESGGLVLLESISRVGEAQSMVIETRADEALALIEIAALVGPAEGAPSPRRSARSSNTRTPNTINTADGSDSEHEIADKNTSEVSR